MTTESITHYFEQPGPKNTEKTLEFARKRADKLGIKTILVATTSGDTAVRALRVFQDLNIVVVSHSTGFGGSDLQELNEENKQKIIAGGGKLLTATHAFGGVGRAVRKKLSTYQVDEIIAFTLRIFGEGLKVACEITLMAADTGLVRTDSDVIAIGGTGRGADTAVVIKPSNAQTFFDLQVCEIICKPRSR